MSVNIYNKATGELIKIAGDSNGVIDDTNVSNKTTYSSEKIEEKLDSMNKENQNEFSKCIKEKEVNPDWDKWNDVTYGYGMDKTEQPIYNTVHGVLESDTMISVTGGKGRWGSLNGAGGSFVDGSHVFEGWNANHTYRLTMITGKRDFQAHIQCFNPIDKTFGTVKIGSDNDNEGVDFGNMKTTFYTTTEFKKELLISKSITSGVTPFVKRSINTSAIDIGGGDSLGNGTKSGGTLKLYGGDYTSIPGQQGAVALFVGDYRKANSAQNPALFLYKSCSEGDKTMLCWRDNEINIASPVADDTGVYLKSGGKAIVALDRTNGLSVSNLFNLPQLASDPTVTIEGSIYYNTTDKTIKAYVNGAWKTLQFA